MPSPTPTSSTNNDDTAAATPPIIVQQAARSPSEFQFAHRLLRKLVQDSTFFPEETSRREYVWFPPRLQNDHDNDADANAIDGAALNNNDAADDNDSNNDDVAIVPTSEEENEEEDDGNNISALSLGTTTSTINGSSDHNHQEEEVQESHIIHKLQQQQQQEQQQQQQQQLQQTTRRRRRRTVSTPLFLDYCLRSHTADINTRRGSLDNNYSLRYNNITRTPATPTNNTGTTTSISNNNNGGGGGSSRERGGRGTTNGEVRATSPTHSFCSSKYSCNSATNITSNTATDSYHENGTSPVSVCSGSVVSGNVSSGGGGEDAVHPTVGVRVGSMMRELPFQRTDVEGAGRETKKENGVKEQSQPSSVREKEMVETGQQQQKRGGYSRTLTRQSSFSDRIVPNQTNIEEETPTSSVVVGQSTSTAATAMTSSSSSAPTDTATTKVAPTTTTTASSSSPSRAPTPIEETHRVYSIHEKELEFGTILGSGGFGQVRLVRIRGNHNANAMVSSSADDNVGVVSSATPDADVATKEETNNNNNNQSNGNNKYYAMKYLSPTKTSPPPSTEEEEEEKQSIHYVTKFERAIADLTMEARFLSVLSHEHIVKLWFVSEGRLETVFNCDESIRDQDGNSDEEEDGQQCQQQYHYQHGYFLLLDALHETLHQRISHTYIPQVIDTPLRIYQPNKKSYSNNTHIAKVQLAKRLSSLKSIALALQYLHDDCNLIYRDIKPSNIGFYRRYDGGDGSCSCGKAERELLLDRQQRQQQSSSSKCTCNYTDIPKLFDFGLAKELKPRYHKRHPSHSPNDPPTFRLTCATGSRRYMSPEVALREPYNHKADVYSFGMVLYQISALVAPFHALDMKNHEQIVAREGLRPDVSIPSKESSVRRTRDFKRHYSNEKSRSKKSLMLSKRARCVWPEALNALIADCWDEDMRKRPEMREVVERLDACIESLNVHPSPS